MQYRIAFHVNKTTVNIGETANVFFYWLKYDEEQQKYLMDTEKEDPFQVRCFCLQDSEDMSFLANAGESYAFSPDKTGTFLIYTENEGAENTEVKIICLAPNTE